MVPGAMFSTVMSAFFRSSLTIATPRGALRLIASDRLLALNMRKYHGSSSGLPGRSRRPGSPVFGFSILTTSAPSQASASVHEVPASNWVKSTTRTPARHSRSWQFSLIADLPLTVGPSRCPLPGGRGNSHRPRSDGTRCVPAKEVVPLLRPRRLGLGEETGQLLGIDGLDEVGVETGTLRTLAVLVLAVASERD